MGLLPSTVMTPRWEHEVWTRSSVEAVNEAVIRVPSGDHDRRGIATVGQIGSRRRSFVPSAIDDPDAGGARPVVEVLRRVDRAVERDALARPVTISGCVPSAAEHALPRTVGLDDGEAVARLGDPNRAAASSVPSGDQRGRSRHSASVARRTAADPTRRGCRQTGRHPSPTSTTYTAVGHRRLASRGTAIRVPSGRPGRLGTVDARSEQLHGRAEPSAGTTNRSYRRSHSELTRKMRLDPSGDHARSPRVQ